MIIDVTGTVLVPGNLGKDCPGNSEHMDVECCCDACSYLLCCLEDLDPSECFNCSDKRCPHAPNHTA